MPSAWRASRRTVSANVVGEGTAMLAVCGSLPAGIEPARVTVTEPSGFVVKTGSSRVSFPSAATVMQ